MPSLLAFIVTKFSRLWVHSVLPTVLTKHDKLSRKIRVVSLIHVHIPFRIIMVGSSIFPHPPPHFMGTYINQISATPGFFKFLVVSIASNQFSTLHYLVNILLEPCLSRTSNYHPLQYTPLMKVLRRQLHLPRCGFVWKCKIDISGDFAFEPLKAAAAAY